MSWNFIIRTSPSEHLRLLFCAGLETLRLKYSSDGTVLPALLGADQVDDLPPSSLRQLEYSSKLSDLDPYLHLLLMRHAATLEVNELNRIVALRVAPQIGVPTSFPDSSCHNELLKYNTDPIRPNTRIHRRGSKLSKMPFFEQSKSL